MLTETQRVTLRDILTTTGLSSTQVDEVLRLLSCKRERVQLAFYYRAHDWTQAEVAERMGVSQQAVSSLIREAASIREYLHRELLVKS